jgi:TolB-like protein
MTAQEPETTPPEEPKPGKLSFIEELKRRKVIRVAITYGVVGWVIIQVAAATFEGFGIPDWAFRFVVLMLLLGFPIALIFAWAFELTPEGVRLTSKATGKEGSPAIQSRRNWLAFAVAAGFPTLIFGTLALFFFLTRAPGEEMLRPPEKSIAVLPFRNMSPDASNQFFCDGVQEDILTTLANIGDLKVISRTSVMPYRDTEKTIPEIAAELGVAYILEGSVQRSGNRVRVTGQLINALTDEHLWARNFDRDLTDIFAIQAELAREITQSLKAVLTPEDVLALDKTIEVHPAAYDLVLKGRSLKALSELAEYDRLSRMEVLFRAATEMDPEYALAWAELSYVKVFQYFSYIDRTEEGLALAKSAIDRALELDPVSPQAIVGLGNYHYYGHLDYAKARTEYLRALRYSPNNAEALAALGYIARREGQWEETLRYFEESFRLDPNNPVLVRNYLFHLSASRRFEMAEKVARHALELEPDDRQTLFSIVINQIGRTGNLDLMDEFMEETFPKEEPDDAYTYVARIIHAAWAGDAESVIRIWEGSRPEGVESQMPLLFSNYTVSLKRTGKVAQAEEILREAMPELEALLETNPGNRFFYSEYAWRLAQLGLKEESLKAFEALDAIVQEDVLAQVQALNFRARSLIELGMIEEALDLLEELQSTPYGSHVILSPLHLDYLLVRDHPRFIALLEDPANRKPL